MDKSIKIAATYSLLSEAYFQSSKSLKSVVLAFMSLSESTQEIIKYFVKVIRELCGKYIFKNLRCDWKETNRPLIRSYLVIPSLFLNKGETWALLIAFGKTQVSIEVFIRSVTGSTMVSFVSFISFTYIMSAPVAVLGLNLSIIFIQVPDL